MRPRTRLLASGLLFAVGQLLLFLLEDRTRASGTYVTPQGIALIAPDSRTYLSMAESIPSILSAPWPRWGYPSLLLVGDLLGNATLFIVLLQSVAAILAGFVLHTVSVRSSNEYGGIAASAALLLNPLTAQWVRFVHTDLLFLCLVVAAVGLAVRHFDVGDRRGASGLVLVGIAATLLRPNGVLVLGAAVACIVMARQQPRRSPARLAQFLGVWVVTAVLLFAAADASGPPAEGSIPSQLYGGVVVEGTDHVRVTIAMPAAVNPEDDSLRAAASYAIRHPLATLRLGTARMLVEIAQVRRHYTSLTNLAVAAVMLLFFSLLAAGAFDPRSARLRRIGMYFSVPLLLLIGATFAVPEGRYGWAPLIALAPLAGVGAGRAAESLGLTDRVAASKPPHRA